jgi:hypothetical protein
MMRNISWWATTRLGTWAQWLLVTFIILRILRTFLPNVIQLNPDFNWWMIILWPNPLVFAVGWVAGICAWVAIIRQHERAVVVYVAATVAVLITLLLSAVVLL